MIRRQYYILMSLIVGCVNIYANVWTRTIGDTANDCGYSICQAEDSGYAVAGYTESYGAGMTDAWLVRTDSIGIPIWEKTFGGPDSDGAYSMCKTIDSGYILAGYTKSFGAGGSDIWLIKTNINGDTLWTRTYGFSGDECAYCVKQTGDSGYIVSGTMNSGQYAWLLKLDANGDTAWTKIFKGYGYGRSVCQTVDSGYILTGYADSLVYGGKDAWLIKTNANGDTSWTRVFGSGGNEYLYFVALAKDSGYIMTGKNSGWEVWVMKVSPSGNEISDYALWDTYGAGYFAMQLDSSYYIVAGAGGYYSYNNGALIVHCWRYGSYWGWDRYGSFSGRYDDGTYSVLQLSDSVYIMAGYTDSYGKGKRDLWLIRTEASSWGHLVGVEEAEAGCKMQEARLKIEPNLVISSVRVTFYCNSKSNVKIALYDIAGREVKLLFEGNVKGENTVMLNTSSLVSGRYFLRMYGNGDSVTKGITVVR